ncbi:MAG: hypothetical protein Q8N79_00500 [Candidatus Methanoperedens sp.]|nr:hypothetical protein [Candidatus Methanoperedens sp.]
MRSFDFIGIPRSFAVRSFIILIVALSMCITKAYHTCLFLWARDVEDAKLGAPGTIRPPAPIASARGV